MPLHSLVTRHPQLSATGQGLKGDGKEGKDRGRGETEQRGRHLGICARLNLSSDLQAPTSRLRPCSLIDNVALKSPALTTSPDCHEGRGIPLGRLSDTERHVQVGSFYF